MNMVEGSLVRGILSVEGAKVSGLVLPAHEGRVLVVERPHDWVVDDAAGSGLGASGVVEAMEPLGSKTLVHVQTGKTQIIATAPRRVVPKVGSTITFHAGAGSVYLFDAASEKALGRA